MNINSYEGKEVIVVGCHSGMGYATSQELLRLGANVHGFDIHPSSLALNSFQFCDLRDEASITAAVDGISGPIDALFNCAGLPHTTYPSIDVMKVNFIGMRAFTNAVLPHLSAGSGIATISSTAGMAYLERLDTILDFLSTQSFREAVEWCEGHEDVVAEGYGFSKQSSIVWTMLRGTQLIKQGIRINCISPGPTTTPMMPEFEKVTDRSVIDMFIKPIDRRATPDEQAHPLIFLNSSDASYINGHNLNVDGGFVGGLITKQIDLEEIARRRTETNS